MVLKHIVGLFIHPAREWDAIREERCTIFRCYLSHTLILAALPAISACLGATQVGWSVAGAELARMSNDSALLLALAYTVYLLYTGIPIVMQVTREQGFLFASALLTVGLSDCRTGDPGRHAGGHGAVMGQRSGAGLHQLTSGLGRVA